MKLARLLLGFLAVAVCAPAVFAAPPSPVTWTARLEPADVRAGEGAQVVVTATVDAPWHLYSMTPTGGPKPTSLAIAPGKSLTQAGKPIQPTPKTEFDKGFKVNVEYYEPAVAFAVPVKVAAGATGSQKATVNVGYMTCKPGQCLPPRRLEVPVTFTVQSGAARPDHLAPVTTVPPQPGATEPAPPKGAGSTGDRKPTGLLLFVAGAFLAGLGALFTPCVFPMIPVTVSYFSKKTGTDGGFSLREPLAYCLGIIGMFTALGLVVTAVAGPFGVTRLAGNWYVNLGLGILFVVLAVNLWGGFEIILPGWLIEKTQSGTTRGGLVGPMLMGLTFALTSFTCTVPFVGTLLAGAAASGDYVRPTLGMLAFSSAFALPFFLLALFPQWLAGMPKAGGWLVSVKAYMGFLELAAALKFFSNVDLHFQWNLLTQPVFLALWAAIAAVAACYMFGVLQLPQHGPPVQIGTLRRTVGLLTALMAVGCLLSVREAYRPTGVSLGALTGLLPPPLSQYPRIATASAAGITPAALAPAGGLKWIDNYDEAVKLAKAENKPLLLNFTGQYCTNCRTMEGDIFPAPEVASELRQFIPVELVTDTGSPQANAYQDLMLERYGQTTLPLYVVVNPHEEKLGEYALRSGADINATAFSGFLRNARSRFTAVAANR